MTNEALADRIITYSDAMAAFSLVNALTFVVTLGEPDIRCSIVPISSAVIAANFVFCVVITIILIALRRFELSLREEEEAPRITRFWRYVQAFRLAIVWSVGLLVIGGLIAATQDPLCQVAG